MSRPFPWFLNWDGDPLVAISRSEGYWYDAIRPERGWMRAPDYVISHSGIYTFRLWCERFPTAASHLHELEQKLGKVLQDFLDEHQIKRLN